jgi:hypothetical protein
VADRGGVQIGGQQSQREHRAYHHRPEDRAGVPSTALRIALSRVVYASWVEGDEQVEQPLEVADALLRKGVSLAEAGRIDEAVTAYDELIALFGESTEPALRDRVT